MRVTTIDGRIEVLGESWKQQGRVKTYDYISFQDRDGQDIVARKVRVWDEVDRILSPGARGVFVIGKVIGANELHAVKVGDREAFSEWLQGGLGKIYALLVFLLVFGLLLSWLLIGIPLVILAIWGLFGLSPWRKQLIAAARAAGFKMTAVKII